MKLFKYIANEFDLARLRRQCNVKECTKKPDKEHLLKEFDAFSDTKKDIGSIFLCNNHSGEIGEKTLYRINELCPPGKAVTMKVIELGVITF